MIILLIKYYQETFIVLIILSTWLSHFSIGGADIFTYLSCLSLLLLPVKEKNIASKIKLLPIKGGLFLLTMSFLLTCFFNGNIEWLSLFTNTLRDVINIIIFWCIFIGSPKKYIGVIFKTMLIYASIIGICTILEAVLKSNPYIDVVNQLELYKEDFVIDEIRFGFKRSQSLFSMHTTNAGVLLMLFSVIAWFKANTSVFKRNKMVIFLLVVLLSAVFLTGARSAIFSSIICMLMFYDRAFMKISYFLITCMVIFVLYVFMSTYISDVISSFLDTQSVGGSSSEMRTEQFYEVLRFFNKSVIFGNGINYTFLTATKMSDNLYGAESIWFVLLIDRGLFGVFAFILFIIQCLKYICKSNLYRLSFLVIGFLVFNTMSSIPHFNINYIFIYLTIIIEETKYMNNKCTLSR